MAENGHSTSVREGMFRTFAGVLSDRLGLASRLASNYGGQRPLHDLLGYQKGLRYVDYKARYERQDIAHAIIHAYPDGTWSQPPEVYEDDQTDDETPFEAAWTALCHRLGLYRSLHRADLLANIGHYALVLIGLRGQPNLDRPAGPVRVPEDVLYLQPYSEEFAQIEQLEQDAALPTYGQPLLYRLTSGQPDLAQRHTPPRSVLVHASRVIHVAEDLLDDDIYGVPRLKPIYDRLDDLFKIVGGGAEGFWLDSRRRFAALLRDGYVLSPEDRERYLEQVEKYSMDMTNFLNLGGMDIQPLNGQVASPKDHFDILLSLIAGTVGIPKSILLGAERGTLASAEEESMGWKERIAQRQQSFAEPLMLRALIDRLLLLGALPAPTAPYLIQWPNLKALSETQQATVAKEKASAYNQYEAGRVGALNAGLPPTIPPQEFRAEVLGLDAESEYALEMPAMLPTDEGAETPGAPAEDAPVDETPPADHEERP
jgi:hypothetical protein